jgi:SET domain-containing protein
VMRITDDEFIDGSNPETSGLARYMNHAWAPNVRKFIAQVDLACEPKHLCRHRH